MSKPPVMRGRLEASLSNGSISSLTSTASRQRSYLTSHVKTRGDIRNRHNPKDSNGVKNSLAKFLAESEDEDLMFIDVSIPDKKDRDDASRNKKDKAHDNDDDAKTVQSDVLFNRDALSRAGTATSRRTRSGNLKAMSSPSSLKGESRKRPERRRLPSRSSSKAGENGDGDDLPRRGSGSRSLRRVSNKETSKNNDGDGDGDGDNLLRRGSGSRSLRLVSNKETSKSSNGDGDGDGDGDNLPRRGSGSRSLRRVSNKETSKSSNGDGADSPRRGSGSRTSRRIPNRESSKKSDDGSENSREINFDQSCDSLPFEEFEESFNSHSLGGRKSQNTRQGSGSNRSTSKRTSRREAQRKSMQKMELSRTPRSRRSDARSSKTPESALSMGLRDLDRQSHKDLKKDRYKQSGEDGENGSVGSMKSTLTARYRRSAVADGDDESVGSMRSMRSTNTALTQRSSYKPSGLEGGALGAFMSNDVKGAAAKKSGGGSVVSAPAADAYMQERKAQQDMILDTAVREKWKKEAEKERIEKERQAAEEGKRDKRLGLVNRVKSVAKKTAELSRTGSIGALNMLLDPLHVGDQEHPVRRGRKSSRPMTGADNAKNEKSTQDIVFNPQDDSSDDGDDESEGEIAAYDPKILSDRQTESLLERWTHKADDATEPQNVKKTNRDQSEILVPALALSPGIGKEFNGNNSWWDL
eukprot:CAMPEP_0172376880 /NCGR_PEP_ID=MMETSP1060-20121228/68616_1 /TAXON_ID=37318 /ORGANISM="Pseudo-nitzschia pungens, Strain cf. cingulata" /LENGTH=695 /DNA_ID=CAMNT_0013104545 /DNA_START=179 /DNA_END=2266 /DNA_ORIENTATION=-